MILDNLFIRTSSCYIMKKIVYRADSRGESNLGWLVSRFSFSFADYYDPTRMGFGKLRVLNDDIIAAGTGFGGHPHKNMEIITIVLDGELRHEDSTGVREVIRYGDIQVMSAGSGIVHSEHNNSASHKLELLQIWIETKENNIKPRHDKRHFDLKDNTFTKIVSGIDSLNSLYVHQEAQMFLGVYSKNTAITHNFTKNNGIFVFIIDGEVVIDNETLHKRDAIGISDVSSIDITVQKAARFVLIDIPLKGSLK